MINQQIINALVLPTIMLLGSCHTSNQTITSAHGTKKEIIKTLDTTTERRMIIEIETIRITKTDTIGRTTTETKITSRQKQAGKSKEKKQAQTKTTITNQRDTTSTITPTPNPIPHKNTCPNVALIVIVIITTAYFLTHSSKH